ncbi:MAG: hypothetical protein H0X66_04920 [Verrucomicrobia bacterium]|nr:hypothetical protein [Verrucomicrobiota bacterium]
MVILAYREYETWFLSAADSLRGVCGLPSDLCAPSNPESIRDAIGWLSNKMPVPYNEPEHQPRMTGEFHFEQAMQSQSFNRGFKKLKDFLLT